MLKRTEHTEAERRVPRIELDQPLPETVAVGTGTALFLRGTVAGIDRRAVERIIVADDRHARAALGWGLRPRGEDQDDRWAWWALHPIPAVPSPMTTGLMAMVELKDDKPLESELGELSLTPGLGIEHLGASGEIQQRARRLADGVRTGAEPVIAIAMATYEPEQGLLERQIDSIREQTFGSWICLISDDHSSVEARRALRRAIARDSRFLLWPSPARRGAAGNFERALSMVPPGVEYVAPADQSGYWYPEKLSTLHERMEDDVALAFADLRLLSGDGEVLAEHWCDPHRASEDDLFSLLASNYVPGSNSLFRREVLERALPFPPGGSAGRYDHWLAAAAMTRGKLAFEESLLADHHTTAERARSRAAHRTPGRRHWQDVYFDEHARMLVVAAVLRLRGGVATRPHILERIDAILGADRRPASKLRRNAATARLSRRPARRERSRVLRAVAKERKAMTRRRFIEPPLCPLGPETSPRAAILDIETGASSRDGEAGASGNGHNARPPARRISVEVRDLHKTYDVPPVEPRTMKSRLRRPLRHRDYGGSLTILDGISFEVERGEMFGILGRNGSGKSTLLRILAGAYGFDSGTVRVPHRIAPLIELGVGFEMEFAALKNVVINLEMLGIPEPVARRRFDWIIEFAGLEDFIDLKLRNYSSGMRSRLAFGIAMSVDAELMLLDEVLAVGDPAFQRKCETVFDAKRKSRDLTILLVTQQPSKIQRFCDRALLLERGQIEAIGDSAEVAARYAELSLSEHGSQIAGPHTDRSVERSEIELWLEDEGGEQALSVHSGEGLRLHASIEAIGEIEEPGLRIEIRNRANAKIFAPPTLTLAESYPALEAGQRIAVEAGIENKLAPGPYTINASVVGLVDEIERAVSRVGTTTFAVVPGEPPRREWWISITPCG